MRFSVAGAPHLPPRTSVGWVMRQVLYALIPAIATYVWFFGIGILVQMAIACTAALAFEAWMLRLRGKPLQPFISDGSALVTAVLYCLCLPPVMPWWSAIVGLFFAIVVAKHLYGGLGHNLFNPALVGYVVILVAFPKEASTWLLPSGLGQDTMGVVDTLSMIFTGMIPDSVNWDSVSGATPLDLIKTGTGQNIMVQEIRLDPVFGDFGGHGWEWVANFYVLGGIYLLYRRVISWQVPVGVLASVFLFSLGFYFLDPNSSPSALQQVFSGGLLLGAFFIATDPVSGCTTPRGRLLFGLGVGLITIIIRRWGTYPDGVAFAVLLMNTGVPLLDRITKPRVYGQ